MTHLSPPPGSLSQQAYHEDPDSRQVRRVLWTLLLGGTVVSFSNSALNPAIPVFITGRRKTTHFRGWFYGDTHCRDQYLKYCKLKLTSPY
ncbi:hypothetical protein MN210_07340 [Psychrobacter raelei]|uniref:Uncharacterized protein n=1 Tax=Psychrobacter raelei TaxID=2565531 RepID=A0AAT9PFB5_9GAMM